MSHLQRLAWIGACALAAVALHAAATGGARPIRAEDVQDARHVVDQARLTFESFAADPQIGPSLRALVKRAKGVLIYPQVLRGALLLGATGGTGVLLVRNGEGETWSNPAFYSFGQASTGLQAGVEASEAVLVVLTDGGVRALLSGVSGKVGAHASVAVGPVGAGAEAAAATLSPDLVSYSRNRGLYAGLSLEGAYVAPWGALNRAYYGRSVTPRQILIHRKVSNPHAATLIAAVARVAGGVASAPTLG